jgi:protocatechuate 3,4-dioxygenase beta subunit
MVHAGLKQPGLASRFDGTRPAPIGRALCDGSGRFRVDAERTTSARHRLVGAVAMAPGYGAGWVEIDPDADEPVAEITLRPEQVIEGRLFDLTGRPVVGVRVEVHFMGRVVPAPPGGVVRETAEGPDLPWSHGRERPAWPGPAYSDAEGRVTLRGIGRGVRVRLGVDDPRFARLMPVIDTDDAPSPKTVSIALEPARIIAGRVTDAETGQAIPHARLLVLSYKGSAGFVNEFEADDQGRFRLNPLSADRYSLSAYPPPGLPYLHAGTSIFPWPKGALEHHVDVAMRRGVVIRGKVVEEGTGRPVAGARLSFAGRRVTDEATGASNGTAETAPDGSYQIAVLPGPGYLVVLAPSDDYVYLSMGQGTLRYDQPGGRRFYAHAFVALDPKAGAEETDVTVTLRRGATVRGRVIGPDGRPIASAAMIDRVFLPPSPGAYLSWRYQDAARVRDGHYEVHGLDPDAEVPVHFLDPNGRLGATAMLSGKSGSDGPVTVRLEPCGTARVRLVDRDGKPVAGYRGAGLIVIIVTPGASLTGGPDLPRDILADADSLAAIDPAYYGDDLVSDADGRIALPDLIPGATFSVRVRNRDHQVTFRKEFTIKPGETIDLGEIVVERP